MAPSLFGSWSNTNTDPEVKLRTPAIGGKGEAGKLAKSLPAVAFRDDNFFELERRAIFSNVWILASHTSRFAAPGDFVAQTYAGFSYFIIRGQDGKYYAHHNVCRHRAFPVLNKPEGSASIIACKYHSWSYRQDGSLLKAPKFDTEPDFKKEENSLFPIHLHVSDKGFIFINFSAEEPVAFEDHFGALTNEWAKLPVEEYSYAYSWQVTGRFNWKTLMDGYQECYHCQIGHPGFAKALDLSKYDVVPFTNFARHQVPNKNPDDKNPPTFTFTFPNTGVTTTPEMWYMMRCVPVSAHETRLEYDVYKHNSVGMEELKDFMKFYEQVEQEDYDLCEATQRGLEAGIYSKGTLHPNKENGVLYYQGLILDRVTKHRDAEKEAGRELNPAVPQSQRSDSTCAASFICSSMGGTGVMSW